MARELRQAARGATARLLWALGATHPARRARSRLLIVTFHRVLPEPLRSAYAYPGLAVTPEELAWFLRALGRHFALGTLRDCTDRWRADGDGGPPSLAVTFDDGQRDNYVHARPVLAAAGVRATFFPSVGHVEHGEPIWHDRLGFAVLRAFEGGPAQVEALLANAGLAASALRGRPAVTVAKALAGLAKRLEPPARQRLVERVEAMAGAEALPEWSGMMQWNDLAELAAEGHEIGSHGVTHPLLPQCGDAELAYEVRESRRILEDRLGRPVESFCYPNGDCDARTAQAVRDAGYRRAVTASWGRNAPGADPYRMRRCDLQADHVQGAGGGLSEAQLWLRLSGLHPGLERAGRDAAGR